MKNNKKGFTLLELLIVVAIIGILIAISVVFLGDAKNRGGDAGKIRALAEVRTALNAYFNDATGGNGLYPSGTNLDTLVSNKYIVSIDKSIIYQGTDLSGNSCGNAEGCPSYHLAVKLASKDNKVLSSDKDSNDVFSGSSDCINTGSVDLCYDVTP